VTASTAAPSPANARHQAHPIRHSIRRLLSTSSRGEIVLLFDAWSSKCEASVRVSRLPTETKSNLVAVVLETLRLALSRALHELGNYDRNKNGISLCTNFGMCRLTFLWVTSSGYKCGIAMHMSDYLDETPRLNTREQISGIISKTLIEHQLKLLILGLVSLFEFWLRQQLD